MHKLWTIKNDEIELIHATSKGDHKIKVILQETVLDKNFSDYLVKVINEAHLIAQEIKFEGKYGEVSQGAIEATVALLVQKWSYNTNITIKKMSADLLFAFACRHKFKNGNKRTALVSCVLFLKFCVLFFRNTNYDETGYMGYWEPFMERIVETCSNNTFTEEESLECIKIVIDRNVTISHTRYN
ncbi:MULTISPECIES: type II toxin-antitoxin system death-on-curing family toxin [unclassified Spiroplasma]|uniref:type II toxin-antitoxin system death-on-curing family toxin n=1 Tax=unclassified Spiroplasma TaxID=2637901 RepID=UPI0030CC827B